MTRSYASGLGLDAKERPRIFLDGLNLALREGTGVATYARNLASSLQRLGCQVGCVYGWSVIQRHPTTQLGPASAAKPLPRWRKLARNAAQAALARAGVQPRPIALSQLCDEDRARQPGLDELFNVDRLFALAHDHFDVFGRPLRLQLPNPPAVMHWTYPVPIELAGAKNIYTLHDLVPIRLPHTTLDDKPRYLKLMRTLAARADHIVTVSEASKRDIVDILNISPERVTNTYQSVDLPPGLLDRGAPEIARELQRAFGLQYREYFLFFGAIEPKKNVARLIRAYVLSNVDRPLVLAGKAAWKSAQELELLQNNDCGGGSADARRIIRIDYVERQALMTLARGARALVFPSLYEGFGLPVVEAMLLGTPVITSSRSSLPELAGDAALCIDPYDVDALASAIRRVDEDDQLRSRLTCAGPLQAAAFSASAYRNRLVALYGSLGLHLTSGCGRDEPLASNRDAKSLEPA